MQNSCGKGLGRLDGGYLAKHNLKETHGRRNRGVGISKVKKNLIIAYHATGNIFRMVPGPGSRRHKWNWGGKEGQRGASEKRPAKK